MGKRNLVFSFLLKATLFVSTLLSGSVFAEATNDIHAQAEAIKQEVIKLNQELFEFEEELLYPASTQVSVFLAIDQNSGFVLDSIDLKLNDKLVTSYLYKDNERKALKKGGVQRLYIGSISDGVHKIGASFKGLGSNDRYFKENKSLSFKKGPKPKFIQLIITESRASRKPVFKVKQW